MVIALLISSLLAGAAYASFGSLAEERLKSITLHYTYEGEENIDYVGLQVTTIEHQLSKIPKSETRILLNRLYATNLLYDEANAGRELEVKRWHDRIVMIVEGRRVPVEVSIISFNGRYDLDGFLSYGRGELKTQVLFITQNKVSVSNYMVHYVFEISSETVNLESISRVAEVTSLIASAYALLVVLVKDKELTIISE